MVSLTKNIHLGLILPVFNDWSSAKQVLSDLNSLAADKAWKLSVLLIDDGSSEIQDDMTFAGEKFFFETKLIRLRINLGHQRAIAVGLSHACNFENWDAVIVMDSDGEDKPQDVFRLIESWQESPEKIWVARRERRSEGIVFKLGYFLYKFTFKFLTGKVIDFGNFCIIPRNHLDNLVYMADTWNHLAASIVKSKIPFSRVALSRGKRHHGSSRMNFFNLVTHGLSAISVYLEIAFTRLFFVCLIVILGSIFLALVAVFIRVFSDLAIPGWTSNVVGIALLLFFQSFTLFSVMLFSHLANRANKQFIPAVDYKIFVKNISPLPL